MAENTIIIYATEWCSDCRRARRYLQYRQVSFQWINIDRNPAAEAIVLKTNRGMRSVPTIVFPDGAVLVEPSNEELGAQLDRLQASS